jgi:peptidoglycan/LPS O-acetylase OafA/YrhL
MISSAGIKPRLPALDAWRGMCALLVALFHLNVLSHFYTLSLIRNASLCVDFFFVLSGFIMRYVYQEGVPVRAAPAPSLSAALAASGHYTSRHCSQFLF